MDIGNRLATKGVKVLAVLIIATKLSGPVVENDRSEVQILDSERAK